MADTPFKTREEFFSHVVNPLPLTRAKGDELFHSFQESGYLARQEAIGMTVLPKFSVGSRAGVLRLMTEGEADALDGLHIVLLSHPSFSDDEFDSWVEIVQRWVVGLPGASRVAISRKIRQMKNVEDGVPLAMLSAGIPSELLITYRRGAEWVAVFDLPGKRQRKIWATKNIG